jgi:hypothetical protein
MRTYVQTVKPTQQSTVAKSTILGRAHLGQSREVNSILHSSRRICPTRAQQRSFYRAARRLSRPSILTSLSLQPTPRPRHADESRSSDPPRHPRIHSCPLGRTRHCDKARIQCACVPLRAAGREFTCQALQSMAPPYRSSQNSASIKVFAYSGPCE